MKNYARFFVVFGLFSVVSVFAQTKPSTPPSEISPLEFGQTVEREIANGQKHIYKIHLEANQFVQINAAANNCAITIIIFDLDGKSVLDNKNVNSTKDQETISAAVRKTGDYQVRVALTDKTDGTYRLNITELRLANEKEFSYTDGKRIMSEMEILTKSDSSFESIQTSIKKYQEAIEKFQIAQAKKLEGIALENIGIALAKLGERRKAIEFHERSIQIFRAIGDKKLQSRALNNLGRVYAVLGERQQALEILAEALALAKEVKNKTSEAIALNGIGSIYYRLNDAARAEIYHIAALKIFEETEDIYNQSMTQNYLGNCADNNKNYQKAVEYYEKAIALLKSLPEREMNSSFLGNLSGSYFQLGNTEKSFEYLNEALKIAQTRGDKSNEAMFLQSFGQSYLKLGKINEAAQVSEKSLEIYRTIEDPTRIVKTLYLLTKIKSRLGKPDEAQTHIEEALNLVENFRAKIDVNEMRNSFSNTIYDYYNAYIELLMERDKSAPDKNFAALALQANERARARGLLDLLAESNADIRQGVDAKLLAKELELRNLLAVRMESLTRSLSGKHTPEQAEKLKKEVEQIRADYEQTQAQIRQTSPRYAALTQPKTLSLTEIQTEVLDADSVLLEYALGAEKSFLWVVTKDSFQTIELPKRAEIEKSARLTYDALVARNKRVKFETTDERRTRIEQADIDFLDYSKALSKTILAPAAKFLAKKRLLIVADGALQYVPFASLIVASSKFQVSGSKTKGQRTKDEGQFLIEEHEIINLPSASTLAILRREMNGRPLAPKTLAVLADPVFDLKDERFQSSGAKKKTAPKFETVAFAKNKDGDLSKNLKRAVRDFDFEEDEEGINLPRLPFTRREADSISALLPANQHRKMLDFDATRTAVFDAELANYRFVHFATHSFLNNKNPELSGIVLSLFDENGKEQDGFLRVGEVFNLKLPAELVVLSGCRTGLGKEIKGEGLIGLTRGFMYAGAKRVVVSLWDVNDEGTSELMANFYREMLGTKKLSPASALRQAQISMLKDKRWQNPYFWSAFTLQGEPR